MRTSAKNPRRKGVKIPDGVYEGSWSGYVVTFKIDDKTYTADTEDGIRGTTRAAVTVISGVISVEAIAKA